MFYLMLLLLLGLPVLEIYLFIVVGGAIGALNTILLIFLTAILGVVLVQRQGLDIFFQARQKLNRNQTPAKEMFNGVCVLLAGMLLIIPGFFTDFLGALLLIPAVRTFLLAFAADEIIGTYSFGFMDREKVEKTYHYTRERGQKFSAKLKEKMHKGQANGQVVDAEFQDFPAPNAPTSKKPRNPKG